MSPKTRYLTDEMKLSSFEDGFFKTEVTFERHTLVWFISGETKIIQAGASHIFQAGDIFLIPRNKLATVINYPKDGLPHMAVAMQLSIERLKKFYADLRISPSNVLVPNNIVVFRDHPLLRSCFSSLIPYFRMEDEFPKELASLKITEALTVLRTIDERVDKILANFDSPKKVELSEFMEDHFMFNLPLQKFGYLTGRSLSSFNRDFRRQFKTTPQRWLTRKRLELAHDRMMVSSKKPADVYLEVGFEDLSHFSYAFKRLFGYPPTALAKQP